jgi:predicted AAA+ superfamily ATPase
MVFDNQISYPVGRVEYKVLYPFDFEEFLMAMGETQALVQFKKVPIAAFFTINYCNCFTPIPLLAVCRRS